MKLTMPAVACLLLLMVSPLAACLWDFDTIKMETQRFPGTLELITGKFLRHSKPFYEWRIEDRQKRIAEAAEDDESVAALYDDLAVAQEKVGKTHAAIETMRKKEELWPGHYTTQANLGTFYIHSGQLEKGLEHIEQAIEINPDAHFGREVYQKLLVEYVLSKQVDGETVLPLHDFADSHEPEGFASFVLEQKQIPIEEWLDPASEAQAEINRAIAGVQGMMHFGSYRSPVLLEVLANLLMAGDGSRNARLLACRAYLAASHVSPDEETSDRFRGFADWTLSMQLRTDSDHDTLSLTDVRNEFDAETNDANVWFANLRKDEEGWIAQGLNPEDKFEQHYRTAGAPTTPVSVAEREDPNVIRDRRLFRVALFLAGSIAVVAGLIVTVVLRRFARRRKASEIQSA
jgi:tetratricopeptide (TPR) repeat protein